MQLMGRVLLADDDHNVREIVRVQLLRDGHEVLPVAERTGLLDSAMSQNPDLILLRLSGVGRERLAPLRRLREIAELHSLPVIALQADHPSNDPMGAFRLLAEDVITGRFDPRELSLRVTNVLRRSMGSTVEYPAGAGAEARQVGGLLISAENMTVRVGDATIKLTRTEMKILLALAERAGESCDQAWLLSRVWRTRNRVSASHVQWHINNLRLKLGTDGRRIVTVRGVGYMLAAGTAEPSGQIIPMSA